MKSPNLERLALAGELKAERFARGELESMLRTAATLLADAKRIELSVESRFRLVYSASHAIASGYFEIDEALMEDFMGAVEELLTRVSGMASKA